MIQQNLLRFALMTQSPPTSVMPLPPKNHIVKPIRALNVFWTRQVITS